jgi:hypothetical protein
MLIIMIIIGGGITAALTALINYGAFSSSNIGVWAGLGALVWVDTLAIIVTVSDMMVCD